MPVAETDGFTLKRVQQLLGLSRYAVARLVQDGFVRPSRGRRGEYRFSFQDLALLRKADALRRAQVPHVRILQALRRLRSESPDAMPLTRLPLAPVGARVAVRDAAGWRDAGSGQRLIAFIDPDPHDAPSASATEPRVQPLRATPSSPSQSLAALDEARALETVDPAAAERHYRRIIDAAPDRPDAYLNLGALLSESGRGIEADALYARAQRMGLDDALLRYNWAITLEDLGRDDAAIDAYRLALAFDTGFADAHFNLGRLLERRGDRRGAVRHYSAFRRLLREAGDPAADVSRRSTPGDERD